MIRQNIKIALFAILGLITFWLVMFSFIKIDVATNGFILFEEQDTITIDSQSASYIESHDCHQVQVEYKKQYYTCSIYGATGTGDFCTYSIYGLSKFVDPGEPYLDTKIIIDSLNIYQYLLKK